MKKKDTYEKALKNDLEHLNQNKNHNQSPKIITKNRSRPCKSNARCIGTCIDHSVEHVQRTNGLLAEVLLKSFHQVTQTINWAEVKGGEKVLILGSCQKDLL